MLMGRVVRRQRYSWAEYFCGTGIAVGTGIFLPNTGSHSDVISTTSLSGIVLMVGYLIFHSFTLNWQKVIFDTKPQVSKYQMLSIMLSSVYVLCHPMTVWAVFGLLISFFSIFADTYRRYFNRAMTSQEVTYYDLFLEGGANRELNQKADKLMANYNCLYKCAEKVSGLLGSEEDKTVMNAFIRNHPFNDSLTQIEHMYIEQVVVGVESVQTSYDKLLKDLKLIETKAKASKDLMPPASPAHKKMEEVVELCKCYVEWNMKAIDVVPVRRDTFGGTLDPRLNPDI